MSIEFIWVPSHLGIKDNEYVDKLAQDAVTKNVADIDCCFEIFEHNKLILNVIWRNGNLCGQLALTASSIRKLNQKFPLLS